MADQLRCRNQSYWFQLNIDGEHARRFQYLHLREKVIVTNDASGRRIRWCSPSERALCAWRRCYASFYSSDTSTSRNIVRFMSSRHGHPALQGMLMGLLVSYGSRKWELIYMLDGNKNSRELGKSGCQTTHPGAASHSVLEALLWSHLVKRRTLRSSTDI